MALEVLQNFGQIAKSRERLVERGIGCLVNEPTSSVGLLSRMLGHRAPLRVGDQLKSWDVLRTAEFIEEGFEKGAAILDLGAFQSEILGVLHRMGFRDLTGIDMNPAVVRMPDADAIRYQVGDFLAAPFPEGHFDVVTAISVIEHGFDAEVLLGVVRRLLRPGGCFVASFDYWPEKIDTTGTKFFGMDWRIFSRDEVQVFLDDASRHDLDPDGPLSFEALERPVHCAERDYTFAWTVLRKRGSR
jgi:SAM-dependent methyltransferase